ncbi:MAG: LysR family transcriptional regulator [Gammaproteobacteria bacterium]|nr:LysR family transcriptional regulator [Gammaproteobacteria bacterium]
MDHMQAIRAFTRVVETGGFTRAADSLQMPNATVSKQVQQLERHLGVKLLERTTRRVRVTSDGVAYYERTRHLLAELDEIETTLGRAQTRPRGLLRVDTGGSTASGILIPAFPEFRVRYPEIQLQLGVTDRTVDLIGENIDCAIRSTAQDPALIARRIGRLSWTTCASTAYVARYGAPTHPRQIVDGDFPVAGYFSNSSGIVQPIELTVRDEPFRVEPKYSILVNESNAHLASSLAGIGLVHTLDFMVRPSIERGELIVVLPEYRPKPLEVFVVYPPSRQLSTKVRVFIEWVTQIFDRLGPP